MNFLPIQGRRRRETEHSGSDWFGSPDSADPSRNVPETLYGPPSVFSPSANIPEDIYGPPDATGEEADETDGSTDFDPERNMNSSIYGPPSELDRRSGSSDE